MQNAANAQRNNSACRNVVFTVNNPTQPLDFSQHGLVRAAVWQLERGESGTVHFQGYAELTKPAKYPAIKQCFLPGVPHLESRKGSREQAVAYCQKEETRVPAGSHELAGSFRYGEFTGQGKRNDLDGVKRAIDDGATEQEVAEEYFASWVKHYRAFERYKRIKSTAETRPVPRVVVLFGESGTGKSRYALDIDVTGYWKQRGQWWCGYEGHKTIVLDDFYAWLPFDTLLRICDRYPLLLETKGGQTDCRPETVVITSNKVPHEWYLNEKVAVHWPAMERRIDEIRWFRNGHTDIFVSDENGLAYSKFKTVYYLANALQV